MNYDTIIIGAGAAGLMCAIEAGKRGRRVLVLERAEKVGKKILISGGGRCNFTNLGVCPERYISRNSHFCRSALARYTPDDFMSLVSKHQIAYHEKKLGQLFCDGSARQIVAMLLKECAEQGVRIETSCQVESIKRDGSFHLSTSVGDCESETVVIATGGISIPKMGATPFGYEVATQFGLELTDRRPGLVPFTFDKKTLGHFKGLSGISVDAQVRNRNTSFRENILLTHRGVSGPAVLQVSSYWRGGESVVVNLLPDTDVLELIREKRQVHGRQGLKALFSEYLPKNFVSRVFEIWLRNKSLAELTNTELEEVAQFFNSWQIQPAGTEGYRTAEVTVGGVLTDELSSKTFEARKVPGLFFIGEVVDVTGWLGGYNFQWAWASGFCAGQYA